MQEVSDDVEDRSVIDMQAAANCCVADGLSDVTLTSTLVIRLWERDMRAGSSFELS